MMTTTNSLPIPEHTLPWVSVQPRPLLPILEAPQPSILPDLPSPSRKPAFDAPYNLTTHLIPATLPRGYPDAPLLQNSPANASQVQRRDIAIRNCQTILEQEDQQARNEPGKGSRKPLWNCLNRYVQKDTAGRPRLTLFLAHANGFPKEVRREHIRRCRIVIVRVRFGNLHCTTYFNCHQPPR
jgi:hypothetical protein